MHGRRVHNRREFAPDSFHELSLLFSLPFFRNAAMKKPIALLAVSLLLLPSCTPLGLATGAGATAGMAVAQEGGVKRAANDAKIQAEINSLWFKFDTKMFMQLDMTVNQGRVLITGVVQNPEHRVEAVRLAWQPKGVKQVINEIRVAKSEGVTGYARDSWISARLRTAITFDKKVQSINYTIDTVQGTVYLMGVAQNQAELNRVVETARTIPDVRQVVSYVKLLGKPEAPYLDTMRHQTMEDGYTRETQEQQQNQQYQNPDASLQPYDQQQAPGNSGYSSEEAWPTDPGGPIQIAPIESQPLPPPTNNGGGSYGGGY
jgi:osmotically-inducible protein OsmY